MGLDFSEPLLAEARRSLAEVKLPPGLTIDFAQANLLSPEWVTKFAEVRAPGAAPLNGVLSFAVMHHLPGAHNRLQFARRVRSLLPEGGWFVHSNWQFQNSPKLLARVQPWQRVGLAQDMLEEGDTLLDWRFALPGQAQDHGYRYVHRFSRPELAALAAEAGFAIVETFESDGTGGNLGLYQRWIATG